MLRREHVHIAYVCIFACLTAVGGLACGKATGQKPQRLFVKGLLKMPAAATSKKSLAPHHGKSAGKSIRTDVAATDGTCSLSNAHFDEIATGTVASDGSILFLVDDADLVDSTNTGAQDTLTYHVRCTATNANGGAITQVATVNQVRATVEATATATDAATSNATIDTERTVESLLLYRGTGVNPLKSTGDGTIPAARGFAELVRAVGTAVNSGTTATGRRVDASLATLIEEVGDLNGAAALEDGTATEDAINLLFTADENTSATTMSVITGVLHDDADLATLTTNDLLGDAKTTELFKGALDVLAANTTFDDISDNTAATLIAALANHPTEEIVAMLATDHFIATTVGLAQAMKISDSASATDTETLGDTLSIFLTPKLVAAADNDANAATVIESAINTITATPGDDTTTGEFMAQAFEKADAAFWNKLVGSDGDATTEVSNLVTFVTESIDIYDTTPAGDNAETDAFTVLNAVDPNTDYAAQDAAIIDAQAATLGAQATIAFNPLSCQRTGGGDYCVDSDPDLQCGCDADCDLRGDCCQDKVDTCGASALTNFLTTNGEDSSDSHFNDDGTADTTTDTTQ